MSDVKPIIYKEFKANEGHYKTCQSEEYNWIFDKNSGTFMRWGRTLDDDPEQAPSPEILDIEISTICHQGCSFCYKSNLSQGRNMSLETFKRVLSKFDDNLTQIAFGIGDIRNPKGQLVHPEMFDIMRYTREQGIIPNVTINGYRMKDEDYTTLAEICGAVAVSNYGTEVCFDCVKKLTDAGCKQVNIHQLLAEETYDECIDMALKSNSDPRLKQLGAIVFLCLKQKGRGHSMNPVSDIEKYKEFIYKLLENKVRFGFDSCSANNFLQAVKDHPYAAEFNMLAEPCESSLFSYYINVDGIAYPCSFCEGEVYGINIFDMPTIRSAWNNEITRQFRTTLKTCKRNCPIYNISY